MLLISIYSYLSINIPVLRFSNRELVLSKPYNDSNSNKNVTEQKVWAEQYKLYAHAL